MTNAMTLLMKTDARPDDNEFVTKGYLRNTLIDFKSELKTELKIEFKGEFDDLKMMILASIEDNRREHVAIRQEMSDTRQMLREDIANVIELIHEKTDPIFKYIEGNEEDKARINRRLEKLESKALLA